MSPQEVQEKLSELTQNIQKAIDAAEAFADEHGVSFGIEPAYGMGGWYSSGEWNASSQSC